MSMNICILKLYVFYFMCDKCILIISTLLFPNLSFYLPIISSILKEREECNGMANVFLKLLSEILTITCIFPNALKLFVSKLVGS